MPAAGLDWPPGPPAGSEAADAQITIPGGPGPGLTLPAHRRAHPLAERRFPMVEKKQLTAVAGAPVPDNKSVMTAGPRGPLLVQDWQLSFR